MKIEKFGVERWMDLYETKCAYNLAETCVASLTVEELLTICGKSDVLAEIKAMRLTYGHIPGSLRLRGAVAALYETIQPEDVLVAHGAIGANSLIYETLVEPGDRVVAVFPTYQQHQSIPKCYGAKVDFLSLRPENDFLPDLTEVERLLAPGVKILALNNPNNPSGSLMDLDCLKKIIDIAAVHGTYILCDEVYRGLNDEGDGFTASVADLYQKGVSTGSMSKVYSLAGLRLGWMATKVPGLLEEVMTHRDYNTISVGILDDFFAVVALESGDRILERSQTITRGNRRVLAKWVDSQPLIDWVPPKSGTTALLKLGLPISSWDFCVSLVEKTGVMLCPGSALGLEGWLRVGYGCDPDTLVNGLGILSDYLTELYSELKWKGSIDGA
jgi:aspartate/methionine/tyrosine aminotransferase